MGISLATDRAQGRRQGVLQRGLRPAPVTDALHDPGHSAEGGAADWSANHYTLFPLHPPLQNRDPGGEARLGRATRAPEEEIRHSYGDLSLSLSLSLSLYRYTVCSQTCLTKENIRLDC